MSQHTFPAVVQGRQVVVLLGFDRPLAGFFLVVEERDEDRTLYSNLDDDSLAEWLGLPQTMTPFVERLANLGITLPQSVLASVQADQKNNAGNRYCAYDQAGIPLSVETAGA